MHGSHLLKGLAVVFEDVRAALLSLFVLPAHDVGVIEADSDNFRPDNSE